MHFSRRETTFLRACWAEYMIGGGSGYVQEEKRGMLTCAGLGGLGRDG